MTGQAMVRWPAFVAESRAQAGIEARRYGVPPTMIEAAIERRSAGDWRRRFDAYQAAGVTEMVLAPQSGDFDAHRRWLDTMVPAVTRGRRPSA